MPKAKQKKAKAKAPASKQIPEQVKPKPEPEPEPEFVKDVERPYAVMLDSQAVPYLRVALTAKGALYITERESKNDVVEMDNKTAHSRGVSVVPHASVLESVRLLLHPIRKGVTVSDRSKKLLEQIQNDKEFVAMEKAKKAKKSAKAAAKGAAPKKAAKGKGESTRASNIQVAFRKLPKDGELPKQAATIVEVVKAKGPLSLAELHGALEGKLETKQTTAAIYAFYRKRLIEGKFIEVSKAA